jgi:hypothetical protein
VGAAGRSAKAPGAGAPKRGRTPRNEGARFLEERPDAGDFVKRRASRRANAAAGSAPGTQRVGARPRRREGRRAGEGGGEGRVQRAQRELAGHPARLVAPGEADQHDVGEGRWRSGAAPAGRHRSGSAGALAPRTPGRPRAARRRALEASSAEAASLRTSTFIAAAVTAAQSGREDQVLLEHEVAALGEGTPHGTRTPPTSDVTSDQSFASPQVSDRAPASWRPPSAWCEASARPSFPSARWPAPIRDQRVIGDAAPVGLVAALERAPARNSPNTFRLRSAGPGVAAHGRNEQVPSPFADDQDSGRPTPSTPRAPSGRGEALALAGWTLAHRRASFPRALLLGPEVQRLVLSLERSWGMLHPSLLGRSRSRRRSRRVVSASDTSLLDEHGLEDDCDSIRARSRPTPTPSWAAASRETDGWNSALARAFAVGGTPASLDWPFDRACRAKETKQGSAESTKSGNAKASSRPVHFWNAALVSRGLLPAWARLCPSRIAGRAV